MSDLRDAPQVLFRMIAEVLTYRMGWMEVTFTNRINPGRGLAIWNDRIDPELRDIITCIE